MKHQAFKQGWSSARKSCNCGFRKVDVRNYILKRKEKKSSGLVHEDLVTMGFQDLHGNGEIVSSIWTRDLKIVNMKLFT